jgi:hypothetical protein
MQSVTRKEGQSTHSNLLSKKEGHYIVHSPRIDMHLVANLYKVKTDRTKR